MQDDDDHTLSLHFAALCVVTAAISFTLIIIKLATSLQ